MSTWSCKTERMDNLSNHRNQKMVRRCKSWKKLSFKKTGLHDIPGSSCHAKHAKAPRVKVEGQIGQLDRSPCNLRKSWVFDVKLIGQDFFKHLSPIMQHCNTINCDARKHAYTFDYPSSNNHPLEGGCRGVSLSH